jgi:2-hydroxychromene-2-carboxylate isomerase
MDNDNNKWKDSYDTHWGGEGGESMRTLDWYFDFVSPYAYLQLAAFPTLPDGVEVRRKPVLLGALLNRVGTLGPAEIPGKREFTYRQVLWLADRHRVPIRLPPRHPFNPLSVLRLAIALEASPAIVRRIFDFIWAEGRDPSDPSEFDALAQALEVSGAQSLIADPAVKARLRRNTDEAIAAGAWGVPTFVVDDLCFWGFDAGDMLLDHLADPSRFSTGEYSRIASLPATIRNAGGPARNARPAP